MKVCNRREAPLDTVLWDETNSADFRTLKRFGELVMTTHRRLSRKPVSAGETDLLPIETYMRTTEQLTSFLNLIF
jgi:hypothetical protein